MAMRSPPGVRKVIAGPGRQVDRALRRPAAALELRARGRQVRDGEQVDRAIALQVIREEDRWRCVELHHRDADAAVLDREPLPAAEDVDEVAQVARDVRARGVQVVEAGQGHRFRASVG